MTSASRPRGSIYDTLYVSKMSRSTAAYSQIAQPQRSTVNVYDASQDRSTRAKTSPLGPRLPGPAAVQVRIESELSADD